MLLPHSEFLGWEPGDREALAEHQAWQAESCNDCHIHPSFWKRSLGGHPHAVVAEWVFCRVCELIQQAKDQGPPTKSGGWHIELRYNDGI